MLFNYATADLIAAIHQSGDDQPPAVELAPGQPLVFEGARPVRFDITRSKPPR